MYFFNIKCIGELPGPMNEFERSLVFETGKFERPKFDCMSSKPCHQKTRTLSLKIRKLYKVCFSGHVGQSLAEKSCLNALKLWSWMGTIILMCCMLGNFHDFLSFVVIVFFLEINKILLGILSECQKFESKSAYPKIN